MCHSRKSSRQSNKQNAYVELTLNAMLKQEENFYKVDGYFQNLPTNSSEIFLPVDADARQKIAKWCMSIMEACHYPNEVTAVIMSCLDRFVSTENGKTILLDRCQYQLAALTALYSSVKIHCPVAISSDVIAKLSRGAYDKDDVHAMERRMLDAIQWRVNPPTAMGFVRIYLDLSTDWNWLDLRTQHTVLELVVNQINHSIIKFEISTSKVSQIATASLLNAIKIMCPNEKKLYESIHGVTSFFGGSDQEFLKKLQRQLDEATLIENGIEIEALEELTCEYSVNMKEDAFSESPRLVYCENNETVI